jgi:hypothetical protein
MKPSIEPGAVPKVERIPAWTSGLFVCLIRELRAGFTIQIASQAMATLKLVF